MTLLGVKIDSQLTYDPHLRGLCKRASQKTKALLRIRSYLTNNQTDLLTYILSHFNYCPLVWILCSKTAHDLINASHRRALRAEVNKFSASFDELLNECNTVSIHTKNLRLLVIEVYRALYQLGPEITGNTYNEWTCVYNLRRASSLLVPRIQTVAQASFLDFRASLACNSLPANLKSLNEKDFRDAVNKCTIYCKCRLCITF